MRARTILLTLVACFIGAAVALAADVNVGTWKLNSAKSKFSPGTPKNDTVIVEIAGENMKITVDGTDGDGKPAHNMWTGKFDGKDYPVTGDPASDMRSYTTVNDQTWTLAQKKGGKVTTTGRIVVSADGKSRTVTINGTDPQAKVASTAVYDKQ
ncbi:MAG TPA: hypothetical protein VNZ26_32420 [Vicinamibacterales bacterium]|jgi:hypothetical protein|nr:hypothetical protein [Vicinamibacterales bacterium]